MKLALRMVAIAGLLCVLAVLLRPGASSEVTSKSCPCQLKSLCDPVKSHRNEIFAFVLPSDRNVWEKFDWNKLTTIALFGFVDHELLCYAHKHNVRVVTTVNFPAEQLLNQTHRTNWVKEQLHYVKKNFLDGINIDFESEIRKNSPEVDALSSLVAETGSVFRAHFNGSQVTFDVPWSPKNELGDGVDGRNYDFVALSKHVDFLFVMSYDTQSQMFYGNDSSECYARPNGAVMDTAGGIFAYFELGIKPASIVLGQPWYGYDYQCTSYYNDFYRCYLKEVPFRGVNCSDAAGRQLPYSTIMEVLEKNGSYYSDLRARSPYVLYKDTQQKTHQVWYDDRNSLGLKYTFALQFGLKGIGIWNANCLNYTNQKQVKEMWSALPNYRVEKADLNTQLCS